MEYISNLWHAIVAPAFARLMASAEALDQSCLLSLSSASQDPESS